MTLQEQVYKRMRQVPKGKITTYKDIGDVLDSKAYRAIGQICRNNPDAPRTPCHRVVSASGAIGGFNGQTTGKEIQKKIALLKQEGVTVTNGRIQDFDVKRHRW